MYTITAANLRAGIAPGPGFVPTDSMLQALSGLTPAQVQRLAAAGQQQQQQGRGSRA